MSKALMVCASPIHFPILFLRKVFESSFSAQLADLSLRVYTSFQQVIGVKRPPLPQKTPRDPLEGMEYSRDIILLKSLIKLVERQKQNPLPSFARVFSQYSDALNVYNGSLSQMRYHNGKEERDFFPWKMVSFFRCAQMECQKIHPDGADEFEKRLSGAVVQDLPLLKEIYAYARAQEEIHFLQMKLYQLKARTYFKAGLQFKRKDPLFLAAIIRCEPEVQMRKVADSRVLSLEQKVSRARKIWQETSADIREKSFRHKSRGQGLYFYTKARKLKYQEKRYKLRRLCRSGEIQHVRRSIQSLERAQNERLRKMERLSRQSKTYPVSLAIEALYEFVNLNTAYQSAQQLLNQRGNNISTEVTAQIFVIIGEALTLVLHDRTLNIPEIKNIQVLRSTLREIRGFFEHPEDYFFRVDVKGNSKEAEYRKLKLGLYEELDKLCNLLNERIQKIQRILKPHLHKDIDAIGLALITRKEHSPTEESHHIGSIIRENFPQLIDFRARILDNRSFYAKPPEEQEKLKPFLVKCQPEFPDPVLALGTEITALRLQLNRAPRSKFEEKLTTDLGFRLEIQRRVGQCYRLLEALVDRVKQKYLTGSSKYLEDIFYQIKDARNMQTHDLWRKNFNALVQAVYLLADDLFDTIITERTPYPEHSREVQMMQKIVYGRLSMQELQAALRDKNFNMDAQDSKGRTLLHFLAEYVCRKHLLLAQFLVEAGANIHLADYAQMRPLHYACQSGFEELVVFLVQQGAVVSLPSRAGTPLEIAQNHEHLKIALFLSEHESEDRKDEARSLVYAIKNLDVNKIRQLLQQGALPWLDFDGELPLVELFKKEDAAVEVQLEIARLLLGAGADMNQQDPSRKLSCLHVAATNTDDPRIIQFLMRLNPAVNLTNSSGETPLICSVKCRNDNWIRPLIAAGANLEVSDPIFGTALLYALDCRGDREAVIHDLLDAGADPRCSNEFVSGLDIGLKRHSPEILRRLLIEIFNRNLCHFPPPNLRTLQQSMRLTEQFSFFESHLSP
ncbi:MAG: ankyrin repeat domain-containing protein [Verrucomicrobia bacterium]|nr:ankyrin repeat domain-containing protein [Verrucomicrobiota bacterium]